MLENIIMSGPRMLFITYEYFFITFDFQEVKIIIILSVRYYGPVSKDRWGDKDPCLRIEGVFIGRKDVIIKIRVLVIEENECEKERETNEKGNNRSSCCPWLVTTYMHKYRVVVRIRIAAVAKRRNVGKIEFVQPWPGPRTHIKTEPERT